MKTGLSLRAAAVQRTVSHAGICARALLMTLALWLGTGSLAYAQATRVQTPYANPKVLVDVYLDHPVKMSAALYLATPQPICSPSLRSHPQP